MRLSDEQRSIVELAIDLLCSEATDWADAVLDVAAKRLGHNADRRGQLTNRGGEFSITTVEAEMHGGNYHSSGITPDERVARLRKLLAAQEDDNAR